MLNMMMGAVSSGGSVSRETLTVTWNRSTWDVSTCSISETLYNSGKYGIVTTGTDGSVVGTIHGSEVLRLYFTNKTGYGSNANGFSVVIASGSALPQSYFTSIEVPGKFTLLTSAATFSSNTWNWVINTPYLPNGSVSSVYVK